MTLEEEAAVAVGTVGGVTGAGLGVLVGAGAAGNAEVSPSFAAFFANTASVTPVGSKSSAFKEDIFASFTKDFSSLT